MNQQNFAYKHICAAWLFAEIKMMEEFRFHNEWTFHHSGRIYFLTRQFRKPGFDEFIHTSLEWSRGKACLANHIISNNRDRAFCCLEDIEQCMLRQSSL